MKGIELSVGQEIAKKKYKVINKIAPGGASTVYKVRQEGLNVDRALKVLDPHVPDAQFELFEETFDQEIVILSAVTHKNIVKIIDYGQDELEKEGATLKFKFFVMEYVEGGTLDEVIKHMDNPLAFLELFENVFEGLCYLHDRFILHGDIKPSNILIAKEDNPSRILEAKLADLGVAKPLKDMFKAQRSLGLEVDNMTYQFGTQRYAPKYIWEFLNKKPISREELSKFLPALDLYCLGATLAEVYSSKQVEIHIGTELDNLLDYPREIISELPSDFQNYFRDFIRRLVVDDPEKGFSSAKSAKAAFQRMEPRRFISVEVPELTKIGSKYSITHGGQLSSYSKRVYDLICHPTFQRLQKLNQLAFVYLIYPDARHSRFSHCLSTFDLSVRVSRHLLGDHIFRLHMGENELSRFLCTALLHDLGHYPLAHVIEDFRGKGAIRKSGIDNKSQDSSKSVKGDYEMLEYFFELKEEGWTDSIGQRLKGLWDVSPESIVRVLDKHVSLEDLSPEDLLIRNMMDSAMDIDKLAYLRLDSRFSGVSYGGAIDIDSLISAMICLSPSTHNVKRLEIGLTDKGISAAESLIIARFHMFSKVYWHHTNRAIMAMTRYVVEKLFNINQSDYGFEDFIEEVKFMSDMEALSHVSNRFDQMCNENSLNLRNPVAGIIDGSRTLYKRFVSFSWHPENKDIRLTHEYLSKCSHEELEELRISIIEEIGKILGRKLIDSDIILDVPQLGKEQDAFAETYVVDPLSEKGVINLDKLSELIGSVFNEFQRIVKKSRVFVHPQIRDELRVGNKEQEAQKMIISFLSTIARSQS